MPQLDFLIFFNEMFYTLVGFITFYILLYRLVIVKLAYNLKLRAKLKNNLNLGQKIQGFNIFEGLSSILKEFETVTSYIAYIKYRELNLVNNIKLKMKEYSTKKKKNKVK